MIDEWGRRRFSREEKLAVLARMAGGASVSALSRELGIARKCLYQWRDRFRLKFRNSRNSEIPGTQY